MLVIRLFRISKKNQPSFKIVVIDKRKSSKAGEFLEEVGFLNPLKKEKILRKERISHWLSVGAKPSPTVYNLLVKEKIIEGKKIPVHKKAKKKEPARSATPSVVGGEKPAVAEASVPVAGAPAEKPAVKEEKPVEKAPEKKEPARNASHSDAGGEKPEAEKE